MAINLNTNNNYQGQIKKLFFLYLKKKKCYDAYVYYHEIALNDTNPSCYSVQYQIGNGRALLRDAFSWGSTTEGFHFWHELAMEWENLMEQQFFHGYEFDFLKYLKEQINNID